MSDNISIKGTVEQLKAAFEKAENSIQRYKTVYNDQVQRKDRLEQQIAMLELEIQHLEKGEHLT